VTRTAAIEWVKALALWGSIAASVLIAWISKMESSNAQLDASAAYDEVAAVSEAAGQKSDSLYLAFVQIAALREELSAVKKSAGRLVSGARRRPPADMRSAQRPAGISGLVTGAASGLWSRVKSLFGGG